MGFTSSAFHHDNSSLFGSELLRGWRSLLFNAVLSCFSFCEIALLSLLSSSAGCSNEKTSFLLPSPLFFILCCCFVFFYRLRGIAQPRFRLLVMQTSLRAFNLPFWNANSTYTFSGFLANIWAKSVLFVTQSEYSLSSWREKKIWLQISTQQAGSENWAS